MLKSNFYHLSKTALSNTISTTYRRQQCQKQCYHLLKTALSKNSYWRQHCQQTATEDSTVEKQVLPSTEDNTVKNVYYLQDSGKKTNKNYTMYLLKTALSIQFLHSTTDNTVKTLISSTEDSWWKTTLTIYWRQQCQKQLLLSTEDSTIKNQFSPSTTVTFVKKLQQSTKDSTVKKCCTIYWRQHCQRTCTILRQQCLKQLLPSAEDSSVEASFTISWREQCQNTTFTIYWRQ